MEELLVSMILLLCKDNDKEYKLKDEIVSCQDYYVNCSINNNYELEKCDK